MVHGNKRGALVLPRTSPVCIEQGVVATKQYKQEAHDATSGPAQILAPTMVVSGVSSLGNDTSVVERAQKRREEATLDETNVVVVAPAAALPNNIMYKKAPKMTMSIADEGIAVVLKQCVKNHLFQDVKFYIDKDHKLYNTDPLTLCGRLLANCHSTEMLICDPAWWEKNRSEVIKAITNRRNNAIKRIKEKFLCKL